jgi:uncharacterized OsmC-like protein
MYSVDVRTLQAPLKDALRRDPARARIDDRVGSLPSDLANPLRVRVGREGVRPFEITVGIHPAAGGDGAVPCPGEVLSAALAACQELTVRMVAASMGVELAGVRVEVRAGADLRGGLGLDRQTKIGLDRIAMHTEVTVRGGDPERARRLLQGAERYCAILDTLRRPPEVTATFSLEHVEVPA